ncbi:GAF domain-containing sensor histidine kinase [Phototrophicus methaneseepsis]|uniref:GAF domain-containing sensor histidine kinase n=1 Tax=Phototrophicus methaneseepsis TaxID=2710758 RepID=A0A7S8IDN1_9CHLR|nr:GAF domain-containing sensor histidine kinase [Phototrophicus methaneseepsis]QPC81524.1 GAF domain-containing sensor histidine kinase [Phototrophicus methaneseepsis]
MPSWFMETHTPDTRQLTILSQIAESLNREVDLPKALSTALERITDLFDLSTSWVFLLDSQTSRYYVAAVYGLPPALSEHPRRLSGTCYCLDTYGDSDDPHATSASAANISAITCTRLKDLKEGTQGLRYHASIPLHANNKHLGVLNVASTDWSKISPSDLSLLHTVGDIVSMAIERARLFRQSAEIGALNERTRLARDMHDTVAQELAAITLQIETAEALLAEDRDIARAQVALQRAKLMARNSLEEVRRSVQDLRAAPLENRTLSEAVVMLLHTEEIKNTLQVHANVEGSEPPLSVRVSTALYRIAQEAINNVVRHAKANELSLELIYMPGDVRLVIEDDGKGFEVSKIGPNHFGIKGIKERVRLLSGRIDLASVPGQGTILEVSIPLEETP